MDQTILDPGHKQQFVHLHVLDSRLESLKMLRLFLMMAADEKVDDEEEEFRV